MAGQRSPAFSDTGLYTWCIKRLDFQTASCIAGKLMANENGALTELLLLRESDGYGGPNAKKQTPCLLCRRG